MRLVIAYDIIDMSLKTVKYKGNASISTACKLVVNKYRHLYTVTSEFHASEIDLDGKDRTGKEL